MYPLLTDTDQWDWRVDCIDSNCGQLQQSFTYLHNNRSVSIVAVAHSFQEISYFALVISNQHHRVSLYYNGNQATSGWLHDRISPQSLIVGAYSESYSEVQLVEIRLHNYTVHTDFLAFYRSINAVRSGCAEGSHALLNDGRCIPKCAHLNVTSTVGYSATSWNLEASLERNDYALACQCAKGMEYSPEKETCVPGCPANAYRDNQGTCICEGSQLMVWGVQEEQEAILEISSHVPYEDSLNCGYQCNSTILSKSRIAIESVQLYRLDGRQIEITDCRENGEHCTLGTNHSTGDRWLSSTTGFGSVALHFTLGDSLSWIDITLKHGYPFEGMAHYAAANDMLLGIKVTIVIASQNISLPLSDPDEIHNGGLLRYDNRLQNCGKGWKQTDGIRCLPTQNCKKVTGTKTKHSDCSCIFGEYYQYETGTCQAETEMVVASITCPMCTDVITMTSNVTFSASLDEHYVSVKIAVHHEGMTDKGSFSISPESLPYTTTMEEMTQIFNRVNWKGSPSIEVSAAASREGVQPSTYVSRTWLVVRPVPVPIITPSSLTSNATAPLKVSINLPQCSSCVIRGDVHVTGVGDPSHHIFDNSSIITVFPRESGVVQICASAITSNTGWANSTESCVSFAFQISAQPSLAPVFSPRPEMSNSNCKIFDVGCLQVAGGAILTAVFILFSVAVAMYMMFRQ